MKRTLSLALFFLAAAAPAAAQNPVNRPAPELVGGPWLNMPENKPVTLSSLRGKVVVLHFWTFG
jgi:hypothetical protein